MSPTLVTFLGFVVAVLIIMWAVLELIRRYTRQKKAATQARNAWVMVKPTPPNIIDKVSPQSQDEESKGITDVELHKRSKQNGHYSQSKKPL